MSFVFLIGCLLVTDVFYSLGLKVNWDGDVPV
jgi:hypothetical protein